MAKGLAVVSGSSTVVVKMLEDGTVVFGQDTSVAAKLSGSLVLNLGDETNGYYLRTDANGTASWSQVSASEVEVVPFSDVTGTNVQDVLEELRADISAAAGSGSFSVSDGGNTESILTDGTQTLTWQGFANNITASYDAGTNTFTHKLTDNVVIANNLTVTNDLTVNGTSSFLNVENLFVEDPLITLASGNTAQTLDQGLVMTRSGSNYAMLWDESADEFVFAETATEDGTTAGNVTITSYAPLQIGDLTAVSGTFSGDVNVNGDLDVDTNLNVDGNTTVTTITASAGLEVTAGPVILPNASINNNELEFSTIRVDLGNGLTSSLGDPFDVALGGTASFAVSFGPGSNQVPSGSTTITISGTANEVNVNNTTFGTVTLGSGGTFTIGLPDDVIITNNLNVGNNLQVTGSTYLGTDSADVTLVNSQLRIPIFTTGTIPADYETSASIYSGYVFYLSGSGNPSGEFQAGNKWYFNEGGEWYKSFFFPGP